MQLLQHSLIILLIILGGHSISFSQVNYDEVKVYLYSEYLTLGISDDCAMNENHTRVFASVKISILEKNVISEIEKQLLHPELNQCSLELVFQNQMVVDFILKSRIMKTVSFSSSERVMLSEDRNIQYKLDGSRRDFYNKYLGFFRE